VIFATSGPLCSPNDGIFESRRTVISRAKAKGELALVEAVVGEPEQTAQALMLEHLGEDIKTCD
jgi:hypothetical protein